MGRIYSSLTSFDNDLSHMVFLKGDFRNTFIVILLSSKAVTSSGRNIVWLGRCGVELSQTSIQLLSRLGMTAYSILDKYLSLR